MSNSVTSLHQARRLQSHILYRCDLQHSNSVNIHLGVLIEFIGADWNVLGMAVRTDLSEAEIAAVAPAWRTRLACPFKYFEPEIERAWRDAESGKCIELLASEYSASLLIEPPLLNEHCLLRQPPDVETEQAIRIEVLELLDTEGRRFLNSAPALKIETSPVKSRAA